ncbi:MAG: electron transport complex subunit RsxC [Clostridia bacterium]|nr:electron transport complex subunit RsxC [Clostridia bacterium]MBQ8332690.1 electron transport complex subunit RsxC [Clostridia bacterium]MBQ8369238.1 electron transport complex subunit RsxC [Clostridia bacterium]
MNRLNGIHLAHDKNTQNSATVEFPLPQSVVILMSQHMGAPCDCLVKKGDTVTAGQKIGDSTAPLSAPIHSSVSGKVTDVTDYLLPSGSVCKAVVIETDGEQTMCPDLTVPTVTDRKSFIAAVRESGLTGLGGAGFPTHVKLNYDPEKTPVDTLVINAAECEPYITSDCRELIESPDDVVDGILTVLKYMNIASCKLCIENNKPEAIALMKQKTAAHSAIEVVTLPSEYPQGAEKVIVYSATGRIIGEGELPSAQGVMVMNVSTAAHIARYLKDGIPLIRRRITFDGDAAKNGRGNYFVPIGTKVSDILAYTGTNNAKKILSGGPMMGMCLHDPDQPVTKTTNAILAFNSGNLPHSTACIRCGRCFRACPFKLMPMMIELAYKEKNVEELRRLKVTLCMNCGCCTYACPAKRPLAETNQLAKALIPRK